MGAEDLQLDRVRSLTQALERMPQGQQMLELAKRLGIWTNAHAFPEGRKPFVRKFSELDLSALSDEYSYWLSEAGRLTELVGLLNGQKDLLSLQEKSAKASARAEIRRNWPDGKKGPSAAEANDQCEENAAVIDVLEKLAFVKLLLSSAAAAKSATETYLSGIDKEIIIRTATMKARISYGP